MNEKKEQLHNLIGTVIDDLRNPREILDEVLRDPTPEFSVLDILSLLRRIEGLEWALNNIHDNTCGWKTDSGMQMRFAMEIIHTRISNATSIFEPKKDEQA